jgi:nicotinamidase-related amidase
VCAVKPNYAIITERVANRFGRQQLDIFVPNIRDVAGILIRNSALTGHPSCASIVSVSTQPITAETLSAKHSLPLRHDRPSYRLTLPLRKCHYNFMASSLGQYQIFNETIDTAKLAAVIVDAWDEPGDERAFRNAAENIALALRALRAIGVLIIHAPHDHPIHPAAQPLADETVVPGDLMDAALIAKSLQAAGIEHLCYMGYVSNLCIMNRPIGFLEMRKLGFNTIFLRDASIAYETEESIHGEWFHKAMVHFIEINGGATASLTELQSAIEEMQSSKINA